jgi:enoyl-CoA hydratase/carnithine racemase
MAVAEQLAALDATNFTLTKRQLRDTTLASADALAKRYDATVLEQWSRPETHENIRAYLAKTLRRKG